MLRQRFKNTDSENRNNVSIIVMSKSPNNLYIGLADHKNWIWTNNYWFSNSIETQSAKKTIEDDCTQRLLMRLKSCALQSVKHLSIYNPITPFKLNKTIHQLNKIPPLSLCWNDLKMVKEVTKNSSIFSGTW